MSWNVSQNLQKIPTKQFHNQQMYLQKSPPKGTSVNFAELFRKVFPLSMPAWHLPEKKAKSEQFIVISVPFFKQDTEIYRQFPVASFNSFQ